MDLNNDQLLRYARHIVLPEVGGIGQRRLLNSRVLVVGAGGLGSPLLLYLAAAGVGTLGIIDGDDVDLENLQRQVIHATNRVGVKKVNSAQETIASINPDIQVIAYAQRLTSENADTVINTYDVIADGSDNFKTRYLINDACYFARKTLVSGALSRFDGQLATFKAYLDGNHPCYRCLFPEPPTFMPSCAEAGILGTVAGAIGSLQATEILKELLGLGASLSGSLLLYNALTTTIRKIRIKRDLQCALCGRKTINDLSSNAI